MALSRGPHLRLGSLSHGHDPAGFKRSFKYSSSLVLQAWNVILDRARPFLFCKGHFHWGNLKVNGKPLEGHQGQDLGWISQGDKTILIQYKTSYCIALGLALSF